MVFVDVDDAAAGVEDRREGIVWVAVVEDMDVGEYFCGFPAIGKVEGLEVVEGHVVADYSAVFLAGVAGYAGPGQSGGNVSEEEEDEVCVGGEHAGVFSWKFLVEGVWRGRGDLGSR